MVQTITLYHATPARNLGSIFKTGLQPGLAQGKLKAVWLHATSKRRYAISHVARRHRTPAKQVAVLKLVLPRSLVRRAKRGIYTCKTTIAPTSIFGVNNLAIAIAG